MKTYRIYFNNGSIATFSAESHEVSDGWLTISGGGDPFVFFRLDTIAGFAFGDLTA